MLGKKKRPKNSETDEDPDAGLDEAWERSRIGIRVNPKRYIKGLVYTHEDKKETKTEPEKQS